MKENYATALKKSLIKYYQCVAVHTQQSREAFRYMVVPRPPSFVVRNRKIAILVAFFQPSRSIVAGHGVNSNDI
jgi:hypothetical protein